MSEQQEDIVKPIHVSAITLQRYGRALVTLHAPVKDTEQFYFTVPKSRMQEVVNSLEVCDSRGDTPRVSFPAPFVTTVKPLELKKDSAWRDLLLRHQGARVELHTRSGTVQGYFLGFQTEADQRGRYYSLDDGPGLVLQTEDRICMHPIGSISAIAFKGVQVAKKLERYSSTLCRWQEADSVYRVNITASGVGTGEVSASYAFTGPFDPAFDFSYSIHERDTDTKGNSKAADGVLSVLPQLTVKCYAVIRNPLHHDVNNVHCILQTGHYRAGQAIDIYSAVEEQDYHKSRSTSTSPSRSRPQSRHQSHSPKRESLSPKRASLSPKRGSPGRASSPSLPKIPSRGNQSDLESDDASDMGSSVSYSTTSMDARRYGLASEWAVPDMISINEGESVKVLLGETQMGGGLVNAYDRNYKARRSMMLHNTTDAMFEPGPGMFFSKGLCIKALLPPLKPGEDLIVGYRPSACAVELTKSSRRGKVLSSGITGKELIAKVMWSHQTKYLVHNKEDEQVDMFITHPSQEKTGCEVEICARLYPNASRAGDEEDEGTGEALDEFSKVRLHWASYMFRMAPKQRSALVVSETESKVEKYSIFGCSKEAITKLEQKRVVGPILAEKLRGLAGMGRQMERLSRTKELHRIRLDGIKGYERGLARANISNETIHGDNGNKLFFSEMSAAEDAMAEIEDSLDTIECERVKLMGQMKVVRQEICDMKRVELENDVKE